jgi:hypothetical protein
MPPDEHDFHKMLLGHIRLIQDLIASVESSIEATPVGQRDQLEMIRERAANVCGVMKADLLKLL